VTLVPVVDISKWQGHVNFKTMRQRGVEGLIVRLLNGRTRDSLAAGYINDAKDEGFEVLGYGFCNPKADRSGADFAERLVDCAADLGVANRPVMFDVENYLNEPGNLPIITGNAWQDWLELGVDTVIRLMGRPPILYSNASYFASTGLVGGTLTRCPLIVARYPYYSPLSPQPPADAREWERWIFDQPKRPQVPRGFTDWQGWQFSAGFNRAGRTYGASSTDLDLNLIKPDAWENWTSGIVIHPPPVEVTPAPVPTPTPSAPSGPIEEDALYYIVDVPERDLSAGVKVGFANNTPTHTIHAFNTPAERKVWEDAGLKVLEKSGAQFDELVADAATSLD
jgi:GH25 family lysozyme M1 (1,4-beta-N-acetylmuramidase)